MLHDEATFERTGHYFVYLGPVIGQGILGQFRVLCVGAPHFEFVEQKDGAMTVLGAPL